MPEQKATTVDVSRAKQELSQLLRNVHREGARVVVEKGGVPIAAIISIQDLERFSELEALRAERFRALDATREAFRDVPDEELEAEVIKALASAREQIREERSESRSA